MSLTAEDHLSIQQLPTRVYQAIDSEDATGFADCFAEDGAFVAAYGEWKGRGAVKEFMAEHIKKGKESGVRHFLTNFEVVEEGSEARVRFYILKMNVGDEPSIVGTAGGDCLVRRTDEGWLFSKFQLNIDAGSLAKTTTGYADN